MKISKMKCFDGRLVKRLAGVPKALYKKSEVSEQVVGATIVRSCFNCGKKGHLKKDCKTKMKQQARSIAAGGKFSEDDGGYSSGQSN